MIVNGEVQIDSIVGMNITDAEKALIKLHGVGKKSCRLYFIVWF